MSAHPLRLRAASAVGVLVALVGGMVAGFPASASAVETVSITGTISFPEGVDLPESTPAISLSASQLDGTWPSGSTSSITSYDRDARVATYLIEGLAPGAYRIYVTNYTAWGGLQGVPDGTIYWAAEGAVRTASDAGDVVAPSTDVDFALPRSASITGIMHVPADLPSALGTVGIAAIADDGVWTRSSVSLDGSDSVAWEITGLWQGTRYRVGVVPDSSSDFTLTPTFYSAAGTVRDQSLATPVDAPAGGIDLSPELTGGLSGQLVFPVGTFVDQADADRVQVWAVAETAGGASYRSDLWLVPEVRPDGSATVDVAGFQSLPPGDYTVIRFRANAAEAGVEYPPNDKRFDQVWWASLGGVHIDPGARSGVGSLALSAVAQLRGTITLAAGTGVWDESLYVKGDIVLYRLEGGQWKSVPAPTEWTVPRMSGSERDLQEADQHGDFLLCAPSIEYCQGMLDGPGDDTGSSFLYTWLEPGTYRLGLVAYSADFIEETVNGQYLFGYEPNGQITFCPAFYEDAATLSAATTFTLTAGQVKQGIELELGVECDPGEQIVGATPTISGSPSVGNTLTAVAGDWTPAHVALSYQWLADGAVIPGATGTTLALTAAFSGREISVRVTGEAPGVDAVTRTSAATPSVVYAVASDTPTIVGLPMVGRTLLVSAGAWGPGTVSLSYHWFADGTPIAGATGGGLTIGASLLGKQISVEVIGSAPGLEAAARTSASTARVVEAPASTFLDVPEGRAFADEIAWLAGSGTTTGWQTSTGAEFRPDQPVLRDQMAAFLYRFAGSPEFVAPAVSPFRDVPTSYPFYKEITWLASTGVTTGWSVGGGVREFRPFEPVLRDQMAAFLYRFAGSPEFVAPAVSPFRDVPTSYPFYKEITWLAGEKISTGWAVSGGAEFRQFQPVLRDQMAAFLYRSSWW